MSAIATKPSALRTCSPSRTSLQKRQSLRATDALLCHFGRTDSDKLTDRAIDEPRRVVVAVAAARPVDEDCVLGADLRFPALPARLSRDGAEPRSPLLLHPGRHGVVAGRARARPRRVREDVHFRDPG